MIIGCEDELHILSFRKSKIELYLAFKAKNLWMTRFIPTILLLFTFLFTNAQKTYKYPEVTKDSTTNVYFNDTVEDPYQWMENPEDPRLIDWLKSQKRFTEKQGNKYGQLLRLKNQMSSMYYDTRVKIKESYT